MATLQHYPCLAHFWLHVRTSHELLINSREASNKWRSLNGTHKICFPLRGSGLHSGAVPSGSLHMCVPSSTAMVLSKGRQFTRALYAGSRPSPLRQESPLCLSSLLRSLDFLLHETLCKILLPGLFLRTRTLWPQ